MTRGWICIRLINVQGLSREKSAEIFDMVEGDMVLCLTETQKKVDDIRLEGGMVVWQSMRDMQDRKGGGLVCAFKENNNIDLEKKESNSKEILHIKGKIGDCKLTMVLVYMRTGNDAEVEQGNREIMRECGAIVGAVVEGEGVLVLGDFNGHLGYLGYQEENKNGKIVNNFIDRHDLILLNCDERCEGTFTWERGEQRSAIDFVMANEVMYRRFLGMKIDENREVTEVSDHCVVDTHLRIEMKGRQLEGKEWHEAEYFKFTEERGERFRTGVEEELAVVGDGSIETLNNIVKNVAERTLKAKYRRKIESNGKIEQPWMTHRVREEIKKRRKLNKEHRNWGRVEGREEAWSRYVTQKNKAAQLIAGEMRQYEERLAEEIKSGNRGKDLWERINKLRGKETKREELKIYDTEGKILAEEEMREKARDFWQGIYTMHPNRLAEKWTVEDRRRYEEELERRRGQEREEQENER